MSRVPAPGSTAKRVASATFEPRAECVGVDDQTPCPAAWKWAEHPQARDLAKQHAEAFPGHRLRVVRETVDLYWVEP